MFKQNKYTKWYFSIISSGQKTRNKSNVKLERHHIIPKSLGGSNDSSNIAFLTLRQHYVAHRLLPKMLVEKNAISKMLYVLHLLSRRAHFKSSRHFELTLKAKAEASRLRRVSPETRKKISEKAKARGKDSTKAAVAAAKISNIGRKHSTEMREKLSKSLSGRKLSDSHREAIGKAATGRKMTEQNKDKLSQRLKNNHHKRYEWILIDPSNTMIRTTKMLDFCAERGLAYSALRYKAQKGDSLPVRSGPSAGWIVFAIKILK
jgi:hypothetical protein